MQQSKAPSLWSLATTIGLPYFFSDRRHALTTLGLLIAMLLAINGLNIVNSYVGRDFMSSLAERHWQQFSELALLFVGVFVASTITEVMTHFVQDRLALRWRDWLTRHMLERYFAGRSFHRLEGEKKIDNPDQRISQDITTFTTSSLSFLVLLVNAILILSLFGGVLWSITPWLFLTMVVYAALGTGGTFLLGSKLMRLDNQQLQKEADFRYALGRVPREHAEAVAQLGGEKDEQNRLGNLLQKLVSNFREIIRVSRNLSFFTTGYNYLPQVIPIVLVAPLYMRGEVEFGTVTQSAMAFSQSLGAFSLIVTQFQQLSAYAAVVNRLGNLWEATEPTPTAPASAGPTVEVEPERRKVTYERVTLQPPNATRPLCRDLSFEVSEGKRVLVTGSSDGGKAALMRATAGEWEGGTGRIIRPRARELFFLPRRSAAVAGRLRDLLLYGSDRQDISDERMIAAFRQVGLESWANQPGVLEMEKDWPNVFSDSERQELAFARLLLANPRFAYLECPYGTLDPEHIDRIYRELAQTPITYISVSDDPELSKYHDCRLDLSRDGTWREMQMRE